MFPKQIFYQDESDSIPVADIENKETSSSPGLLNRTGITAGKNLCKGRDQEHLITAGKSIGTSIFKRRPMVIFMGL